MASCSWKFFLTALYRNSLFNVDSMSEESYFDSIGSLFDQPINQVFSVRLQYFLDYNNIKKVFKGRKSKII